VHVTVPSLLGFCATKTDDVVIFGKISSQRWEVNEESTRSTMQYPQSGGDESNEIHVSGENYRLPVT
jgi:hypothetical protein